MQASSATLDPSLKPVTIGKGKPVAPMALGGSWYVPYGTPGEVDRELTAAVESAYDNGIRHFDTAAGYGNGHSEVLLGQFLKGRRNEVFLASKSDTDSLTTEAMDTEVEASLRRLGVDFI